MKTITVQDDRDFYKTFINLNLLKTPPNQRELEVAAEFLHLYTKYLDEPLYDTKAVYDEETDKEIKEVVELTMGEMITDSRTINHICTTLDMVFTVFRKHVVTLKKKGFFAKGSISRKFTPPRSLTQTYKLVYEK